MLQRTRIVLTETRRGELVDTTECVCFKGILIGDSGPPTRWESKRVGRGGRLLSVKLDLVEGEIADVRFGPKDVFFSRNLWGDGAEVCPSVGKDEHNCHVFTPYHRSYEIGDMIYVTAHVPEGREVTVVAEVEEEWT